MTMNTLYPGDPLLIRATYLQKAPTPDHLIIEIGPHTLTLPTSLCLTPPTNKGKRQTLTEFALQRQKTLDHLNWLINLIQTRKKLLDPHTYNAALFRLRLLHDGATASYSTKRSLVNLATQLATDSDYTTDPDLASFFDDNNL